MAGSEDGALVGGMLIRSNLDCSTISFQSKISRDCEVRPGPRLGGEGGLGARLEERVFKLPVVLDSRNVPAEKSESKRDGGSRFPVNTAVMYAYSFFSK